MPSINISMELDKIYEIIYKNKKIFKKYLQTQSFTINGKRAICEEIIKNLNNLIGKIENKIIGILGCDIGLSYQILYHLLPKSKFVLIDKSKEAIKYIRTHMDTNRSKLYICDLYDLKPVIEKFDIGIGIFIFHVLKDLNTFFKKIVTKLKPFAKLVIVTMTPEQERAHIIGGFFSKKKESKVFLPLAEIIKISERHDFKVILEKVMIHHVECLKKDIPIIFSKYANSFLFRQKQKDIKRFHQYLYSKVRNDKLKIELRRTLLILEKGKE